jgi:hypothetical protein
VGFGGGGVSVDAVFAVDSWRQVDGGGNPAEAAASALNECVRRARANS